MEKKVAENAISSRFPIETGLSLDYCFKILSDGSEFHYFKEGDQLPFHLRDAQMVTKAPKERRWNRWMLRVDLPRMNVENDRVPFPGPASEKGFGQGEWVETQVPSPSEREPERAQGSDRHRDLPDFSFSIGFHSTWMIPEFRPSVTVVPYGKHAAAIRISFVQENLVDP